jgi:hypothetical protein
MVAANAFSNLLLILPNGKVSKFLCTTKFLQAFASLLDLQPVVFCSS